jgi:sulfotransferase family protein
VSAPPFFIVGVDRSGTTMVRLALDRGRVAIPPESMFLVDFAPVRRRGGLDEPRAAEAFLRRVWTHPRVRLWGVIGEAPTLPAGLSHEDAYRFAVEAPFRAYAAAEGKTRWADKTPSYLAHVDELAAVWPEARFVVVVRDGRDVALSLLRVPFGPNNAWAAGRFWARGIRLGRDAEARHPGRVLTVRYEDVVAGPRDELARIAGFVGVPWDDEMLAIERTDPSKLVTEQESWFTNVWAGINASAAGRWRQDMSPRDRAAFESVAGTELERMGYEVGGVRASLGTREHAWRAHDAALRLRNFVRLRLVQERGRELGYVLRRKLGALA